MWRCSTKARGGQSVSGGHVSNGRKWETDKERGRKQAESLPLQKKWMCLLLVAEEMTAWAYREFTSRSHMSLSLCCSPSQGHRLPRHTHVHACTHTQNENTLQVRQEPSLLLVQYNYFPSENWNPGDILWQADNNNRQHRQISNLITQSVCKNSWRWKFDPLLG